MYLTTNEAAFKKECAACESFEELAALGLRELMKFPGDVEIVCGPITSGGLGSIEKNLAVFNDVVRRMLRHGQPLFNQMPYEDQLFALRDAWKPEPAIPYPPGYEPVLERFYRPLFETRRIRRAWFIPNWETSRGATWERELLGSLGAITHTLKDEWVVEALSAAG